MNNFTLNIKETPFYSFLIDGIQKGGFSNDDVVAIILPLLEEVHSFHISGFVAPLENINNILITNDKLDINEKFIKKPNSNLDTIKALFPKHNSTFEISGEIHQATEIGEYNNIKSKNNLVQEDVNILSKKASYLLNYKCFEIELNHHDAVSDIYVLGMLMASMAFSLDFTEKNDLHSFVENRESMIFLHPKIHASIANIIAGMTELDRRKRWKDLGEIINNLRNYRDYNPENEHDLATISDLKSTKLSREQYIQGKLRNRLFDNSRRNRLLYFKANLKFLNLTVSSVPSVLNYNNINPNSLFYWNDEIAEKITKGKDLSLSKYIRFEDNAYIAPTLDKIRLESNRDINEYGFSQLKLVIGFLNWYNLKENKSEKISSPFLLVPVNLVKKKGVKDQYILEIVDAEVEINPVLANMLKDLYDIKLPDTFQLSEISLEQIIANLKIQIEKTRSGIVLEHVNKPKIKLIHAQAKQTLSQYKRRTNKNGKIQSSHNLDYSYNNENFQPLGLQIFKSFIKPYSSELEYLINDDIKLEQFNFSSDDNEVKTRELYTLDEGTENAFKWEVDTCNMVLGNFNYKKMSLVRDYNTILDEHVTSSVFDSLFSNQPKKIQNNEIIDSKIEQQFNVVQSDPTQNQAIAEAQKGENYIIQGPPGTGKSQTISNLIADYVARGKKVLFVCEKRAAIDVVFYRLKQQQLDQLCCLIHDSQTDKKAFIQNLKSTFEQFTQRKLAFNDINNLRNELINTINSELKVVSEFHTAMSQNIADAEIKLIHLIEKLIETKQYISEKESQLSENLIGYKEWLLYGEHITKLSETAKNLHNTNSFSQHPFKYLDSKVVESDKIHFELKAELQSAVDLINEISERIDLADLPNNCTENITQLKQFLIEIELLYPFKEKNKTDLLVINSELHNKLNGAIESLNQYKNKLHSVTEKNNYWLNKFSASDTENALQILQKHENSFFNFFYSSYRNTKKSVVNAYDFSKHQIKPSLTQVVQNLKAEHDLISEITATKNEHETFFSLGDIEILHQKVKSIISNTVSPAIKFIQQSDNNLESLKELSNIQKLFAKLNTILEENIILNQQHNLENAEQILEKIVEKLNDLPAFSPHLKALKNAHKSVKQLFSDYPLQPIQIKALLAKSSFDNYFKTNRDVYKTEGQDISLHISKIKKLYKNFLTINAQYIIASQQERLNTIIQKSEMSVAGKTEIEKEEKRSLVEGRKILENEFTKNIRFKSIRELATSESGQIIRELKPVWLMSPLSVSDTLPLKTDYFDVVIFDEASQITLEEGVPPIYRASQTIIVGDEMQMPPSNFFSSSSADPEDLWEEDNEESENQSFSLDADSFLTQGARKFNAVMLGWHYRSKHESLIGFSNASFYESKLLTIPDCVDNQKDLNEIIVESKTDAIQNINYILDRPISYHYLKNGVYQARSNTAEAEYIAELIRTFLKQNHGLSIGVVAFSMEQQNEIENAIERLTSQDADFDRLIEEEYKRVEDGQLVGIFFKNLENVQGDERDIIIMSTCYGYDNKNKMIMNFGPINRRGGEKRLNVIFSRAKKRMVIVSSIQYTDIKNEYNEGANHFRKYLQYASLASKGKMDLANAVLNAVSYEQKGAENKPSTSILIQEICKALNDKGYITNTLIGQSHFKCHIGVKKSVTDEKYITGILIDDETHYNNSNTLEQYLFKPDLLRYSGWKVTYIFAKDWYMDNEIAIKNLLQFIENEEDLNTTDIEDDEIELPILNETLSDESITIQTETIKNESLIRLINEENGSSKFWEIYVDGLNLVIQYGKIGTKPQRIIKPFESVEIAEREKEKLIQQKLRKEYSLEQGYPFNNIVQQNSFI